MNNTTTTGSATAAEVETMRDIQAIRLLLDRYAFAMDRRDAELMRSCFTADADLSYFGGLKHFTRDTIAEAVEPSMRPFSTINHAVSSIQVLVDGDTAQADMHIFATMVLADRPSVMIRGVHVVDEYRRTVEGWQVSKRQHMPFTQYELPTLPIDFPGVGGVDPH